MHSKRTIIKLGFTAISTTHFPQPRLRCAPAGGVLCRSAPEAQPDRLEGAARRVEIRIAMMQTAGTALKDLKGAQRVLYVAQVAHPPFCTHPRPRARAYVRPPNPGDVHLHKPRGGCRLSEKTRKTRIRQEADMCSAGTRLPLGKSRDDDERSSHDDCKLADV